MIPRTACRSPTIGRSFSWHIRKVKHQIQITDSVRFNLMEYRRDICNLHLFIINRCDLAGNVLLLSASGSSPNPPDLTVLPDTPVNALYPATSFSISSPAKAFFICCSFSSNSASSLAVRPGSGTIDNTVLHAGYPKDISESALQNTRYSICSFKNCKGVQCLQMDKNGFVIIIKPAVQYLQTVHQSLWDNFRKSASR